MCEENETYELREWWGPVRRQSVRPLLHPVPPESGHSLVPGWPRPDKHRWACSYFGTLECCLVHTTYHYVALLFGNVRKLSIGRRISRFAIWILLCISDKKSIFYHIYFINYSTSARVKIPPKPNCLVKLIFNFLLCIDLKHFPFLLMNSKSTKFDFGG